MTSWLTIYYLTGLGLILWLYVHRDIQHVLDDAFRQSLTATPVTKSQKYLTGLADGIVIALLAGFWPLLLVARLRDVFQPQSRLGARPVFAVHKCNLLKEVSVSDAEASAIGGESSGALPGLPFGDFNPAWVRFRESLSREQRLWRFRAEWADEFDEPHLYEGYVAVKGEGPWHQYFLERRPTAIE